MIFQGDVIIKTAIELGLEDMKKNPWLIDDMLSDMVNNPYLKDKYGQKHINACKEWFLNNQIDVYMRRRNDKDRLPCVTIEIGTSPEKEDLKHMADTSTESVILLPKQIGKPIPYVMKPFVPTSYDASSGEVGVDPETDGIDNVSAGMILVNPNNGQGFVIQEVTSEGIIIEAGMDIETSELAVVPAFQYYKALVEHSFFQETYNIGCHAHGDTNTTLWLWSIVLYSLLRYRESLLEANGFSQSVLNSSNPDLDQYFSTAGGEEVWVRYISMTGQVENTWIKSPRRFIENVNLREKTDSGLLGGIKILSNLDAPEIIDPEEENWYTVED